MAGSAVAQQIHPHWLMRLFGAKTVEFTIDKGQLVAQTEKGERYLINARSLSHPELFRRGWLFSRLWLQSDRGECSFGGINKVQGKQFVAWLRRELITQLAPDVASTECHIRAQLGQGFIRTQRFNQVIDEARQMQRRFGAVPDKSWVPDLNLAAFEFVAKVASWDADAHDKLQRAYIKQQLSQYNDFFDQIEKQPLTQRQREACVADETNNLVLAGAGTGKTSTMVGRAGYLLKSGQAQASEILMLAFANKAAAEMQERLAARLKLKIEASTFHKLGKQIIASVEGKQPSLSPLAEDDQTLAFQINQWFEGHLATAEYRQLTIDYFQRHLYPQANPFDLESEGEYFNYIVANDIRTLKGEQVKSLGECLVANYLFRQGVEYKYEEPYAIDTASIEHRQYRPDFYLPDYDIYIEYFGIDRAGQTAPYIDAEKYREEMVWKCKLHRQNGTRLIELFHYQNSEGTLFDEIDRQLQQFNVTYDPLPPEAVLATLREFGAISRFALLLCDLLKRYKANCYQPQQLEATVAQAKNPAQVAAALLLLKPIVADYEAMLATHQQIDFDDMIGKAIRYVKEGRFKSPWRYILVDEFQDISEPRARLIKLLRDSVAGCSLFCVGDDWQAIYRFTGSDLRFTTQFERYFGPTYITRLDLTFRFNNSISDIASRFVMQNPQQLKKELNTLKQVDQPAVSLLRMERNRNANGQVSDAPGLQRVLQRLSEIAKPNASVYLLARYAFNLPNRQALNAMSAAFPTLQLSSDTMHASKGKEADYVVILGLEKGKYGFPSAKQTEPLLEALLPPREHYKHAEERRLFYVALTRARERVYLVTDMSQTSAFVQELLAQSYPIELDEFEITLAQKLVEKIRCRRCDTGALVARNSEYGAFYGCSNFPLCQHKERGCERCGSPMQQDGRFKVCLNPECQHQVPQCPECGAELVKRKGKYGEFWGCRSYRADGSGCRHTEQKIDFPLRRPAAEKAVGNQNAARIN